MRTLFFTGRGDKGSSDIGGKKFSKDDPVFELLGSLDELNSSIGFARAEAKKAAASPIAGALKRLQEMLFIAQAETAARAFKHRSAELTKIAREHVASLEAVIERIDAAVPPLTKFVIPGEDELSARLDLARTAARRAEREAVKSTAALALSPDFLQFLNRLSSVLFALARQASHESGTEESNPRYK